MDTDWIDAFIIGQRLLSIRMTSLSRKDMINPIFFFSMGYDNENGILIEKYFSKRL
jgi:hypothetical protein